MPVDRTNRISQGISPADPLDLAGASSTMLGVSFYDNGVESASALPTAPEEHAPDEHTIAFNLFLNGNDEAFRALYDAFERQLYLYVVRFVGSKNDAEDVFQEVWMRMYRLRGEMQTVRKFSGLLFTVARNLSINALRDRKGQPGLSLEDAPFEVDLVARSHEVEESDMREMLERALMQLPLVQREAFVLREYFGYSYDEVAGIMGTSMVTAKTRAWRGRERLRKMIGAWMNLTSTE
ncbi:MAG TPA: RNA polymerase sigma factor [Candidatus Kapabacteria bacterium]|nr:RNA polymerase sigma factor [Candidatus Kapabacteria bacterium]